MSDSEDAVAAVISGATISLPAPIKTSFFKAVDNLLGGLTAVPAAWLKRHAQGIEDTTAARSVVAAVMAKAVGEGAIQDPAQMQAAAEIYLPTAVRKARNRVRVAQNAAEHVAEADTSNTQSAPPGDDWMNTFMRFAEDASSEQLQDLFGRILAGEVVRPGSFALATLRAVSELDQAIAADFSIVWAKSVGSAVDYSPEFHRGEGFARWKRLAEAGLMAPSNIVQYLPPHKPVRNGHGLWTPMVADGSFLVIDFPPQCAAQWGNIEFTRVGRQIGGILARPDYESNMREAGAKLAQHGVARVELHSAGRPVEVIYHGAG